jgi:hypothetical protein
LAKTVDWSNYGWLNRQSDLRPILNSSDLEVWRNLSYEGVGARYSSISSVTSISQLIAIASHTHSDVAPFIVAQSEIKAETSLRSSRVKQVSPVQFNVPRGKRALQ